MRRLAILFLTLTAATAALAQSPSLPEIFADVAQTRPEVERILLDYAARCDLETEGGQLTFDTFDLAFTETDIDGDGAADDMVVDMGRIYCDRSGALWAGTGGSPIHFVIDGMASQSWSGFRWEIERFGPYFPAVILIARHGSACDGFGAQPCVQAIVYDPADAAFMTVRLPQSNEEDPG